MQVWDLKALFTNEKECEQNVRNLQKECEKFKDKYLEKYENLKTDEFLKAFEEYESLIAKISKVMTYAFLNFAKDTSKGAFYAKIDEIATKANENLIFFEIKFNEFAPEKQEEIIKSSKK